MTTAALSEQATAWVNNSTNTAIRLHFEGNESTLRIKMILFDISDSVHQAPPSFADLDGGARRVERKTTAGQ